MDEHWITDDKMQRNISEYDYGGPVQQQVDAHRTLKRMQAFLLRLRAAVVCSALVYSGCFPLTDD